ncbi:alternate-type signal peptide domain-containing protein [Rhodococcus sp. BH5]|uniref:alternate-type signal peptide domain-containing protein n=1 Tax=Rhodococcus sp. BH5 TaxID=2871702 RepID=UPI0022CD6C93|nr:alternate-type signal peptide domain-containing protein [Rhodococcus sp. BH5]MCZ9635356.1 alternate-type signal peptide domain-containing protein [Rhodococcus sp. BH5]
MVTDNEDIDRKKRRRGFMFRAGLAIAVATALLLGGFGAFSLWSDSQTGSAGGNINTGILDITEISNEQWIYKDDTDGNDGGTVPGTPIDISTFKVSPGDILEYQATVSVTVVGSDMKAELVVDDASYTIATPLADYVTVVTSGGAAIATTGDYPVTVTVTFSDTIPNQVGQDLSNAVSLEDMTFRLNQLAN